MASYKKGILFLFLIGLLGVMATVYITFSRAIISITPNLKPVASEIFVEVSGRQGGGSSFAISGKVDSKIVERSEKFQSTGKKTIQPTVDVASGGRVTIFNTLETPMDLIQKTRLRSADGLVVRLKNKITVPAKGRIEAEIYPDEPATFKGLPVGKMTIPGLTSVLQEKVYAENTKVVVAEAREAIVIDKKDVENAVASLSTRIIQETLNEIKLSYDGDGPVSLAITGEVIENTLDNPVGSEAMEFKVNVKMKVVSVFLDKGQVFKLIDSELNDSLDAGTELVRIEFESTSYVIESYDLANKSAQVKIKATGHVKIRSDHPILDKEKIVDANKKQVEIYFKTFDEVKDVSVEFTPFWVNKVPKVLDKIEIRVR